jgi:hypothetical protein
MIITFLQRSKYLGYYIKTLDKSKFRKFLKYVKGEKGFPSALILSEILCCIYKYNIGIMDYFIFRFYEKSNVERSEWAGTGFMYEYQLKMNPPKARIVLEDKVLFNNRFKSMVKRFYYTIDALKTNYELTKVILNNNSERIVLKNSRGQAGKQVKILDTKDITPDKLIKIMNSGRYDLLEEYIIQHQAMMKLSPSGLNTIRIITQEYKEEIYLIAARIRISINSEVDNLAAGNVAAPVDLDNGIVTGPAVFSDITKEDIIYHPVTGIKIPGFQVPFWSEVLGMVKEAAMMIPENRSVGWDVAITSSGPLLIEGNHNWCKFLWQLPVGQGLRKELEKYL